MTARWYLAGLLAAAAPLAAQGAPPSGAPAARAVDPRPSVPAGRVTLHSVPSALLGVTRRVWVYVPPGYDPAARAPYPLLVAFDGQDYLSDVPLPLMLDTLLAAGKAPPFVAVLVDDSSGAARTAELGNNARFARFLAEELVPWVRAGWHVTADPHRVIITGSSAGGLGAAFAAWRHPGTFANVLAQSGAFWRGAEGSNGPPYEWLTAQVAAAPRADVRFVLDVGAPETHAVLGGAGPVFIEANRRFRDALVGRGYAVTYTEVPGAVHAPESWKLRLPVDLLAITTTWVAPAAR